MRSIKVSGKAVDKALGIAKLPDKPSVDSGPRAYGRDRKGQYIVPRFYVSNYSVKSFKHVDRWWVVDAFESRIAAKTNPVGYKAKSEAVKIAEKYRDTYGVWAHLPF